LGLRGTGDYGCFVLLWMAECDATRGGGCVVPGSLQSCCTARQRRAMQYRSRRCPRCSCAAMCCSRARDADKMDRRTIQPVLVVGVPGPGTPRGRTDLTPAPFSFTEAPSQLSPFAALSHPLPSTHPSLHRPPFCDCVGGRVPGRATLPFRDEPPRNLTPSSVF